MQSLIPLSRRILPIAGMALCLVAPAVAQDSVLQRYSVPGHGGVQLEVPANWRVASKSLENPASVVLRVRPATDDSFDLQVTTVWRDPAKSPRKTPAQLKADVQRGTEKLLERAVEKEARIDELKGAKVFGYHYSLTDSVPAPGEYKYLTQGMFVTGDLLTVFTILYHDPRLKEKDRVLQMLAGAAQTGAAGGK